MDISILLFKEGESTIAIVLELDLVTQGKNSDEALDRMRTRAIPAQLLLDKEFGNPPFHNCKLAPKPYFDMWDKATHTKYIAIIGPFGEFYTATIRTSIDKSPYEKEI